MIVISYSDFRHDGPRVSGQTATSRKSLGWQPKSKRPGTMADGEWPECRPPIWLFPATFQAGLVYAQVGLSRNELAIHADCAPIVDQSVTFFHRVVSYVSDEQ